MGAGRSNALRRRLPSGSRPIAGTVALGLSLALVAAACATSGGEGAQTDFDFVGGVVVPADLTQPFVGPAPARDLGDDEAQNQLAFECHGGTYRSCDDLYQRGAVGSSYAAYAFTCGGRLDPPPEPGEAPNCRLRSVGHLGAAGPPPPTVSDPHLSSLAEQCQALNGLEACDTLYRESPAHSQLESYATTCGYRTDDTRPNACVGFDGIPLGRPPTGVSGDPELDQLSQECFNARISSCDELYASSDRGSPYETYAQTCGGRLAALVPDVQPSCDLRFNDPVPTNPVAPPAPLGDSSQLDGLADACAAGAMASCDELFNRSDLNTDYENYGATCGGRFAAQRRDLKFSAAGECEARVVVVPEGTDAS